MSLRRAFTMIELLVVITIVALLASMLLPVMGQARSQTRSVLCASNLKQIGIGFGCYTNDYSRYFPNTDEYLSSFVRDATTLLDTNGAPIQSSFYLTSLGPTFCPSQLDIDKSLRTTFKTSMSSGVGNQNSTSYNVSVYLPTSPKQRLNYQPGSTSGHVIPEYLRKPSGVFYLGDAGRFTNPSVAITDPSELVPYYGIAQAGISNLPQTVGASPTYPTTAGFTRTVHVRHPNNTLNGLFCDGHAQSVGASEFSIFTKRGDANCIWDDL